MYKKEEYFKVKHYKVLSLWVKFVNINVHYYPIHRIYYLCINFKSLILQNRKQIVNILV